MITVQHHSDPSFDASGAWNDALKAAELNGDTEIFFPRGVYHFYSETKLKHAFISNNDDSVKRIVFYLSGKKNLKIYGDDAKFIFHGRLLPFLLEESQNITISGISIDFATAFHFETKLVETDGKSSLLRVPEKWHLENGRLIVFDDGLDGSNGLFLGNPFIPENGEIPLPNSYRIYNKNLICENENELLRVPVPMDERYPDIYIRHQARHTPAILIDRSDDTVLENVTVHHAEGMAVVGQNSRNILLDHVNVVPSEKQHLSVTDDAVHFSECEGRIEIRNCVFLNTLDDAINIHGMYRRLKKVGDCVLMEGCHFQQYGLWHGKPGDMLELVKADTMQAYATIRCKEFLPGTQQLYCLELDDELPPEYENGDIVRIMRSAEMEVVISNNDMANNMFRGILLSGAKRGLIENNRIHSPGTGIYISGDANYWYESGPVKDLEICGNTFDHCAYTQQDALPIKIDPIIPKKVPGFYYHENIRIHDNEFLSQQNTLVMTAHSVADLKFCRNQVKTNSAPVGAEGIMKAECGSLTSEENLLNGKSL